MPLFSKESLETLKQRIDIVDVLSAHLDLKRTGAAYKALCPFHDEKTPSFTVQKGDSHYHCFGCGAHGDAIQFLMSHLKMNFSDAVESLAQRFHVHLEQVEGPEEKKGPNKAQLKEALEAACRFYHFCLLHTPEGHDALRYLYHRGLDLDFIKHFQIGLAPKTHGLFRKTMHSKGISDENMFDAGLLVQGKEGGWRDFFYDRITFPVHHSTGHVIGFSARKYREETFGGKYVNTPETPLFKKSRVLFGLNYCRRRIAKERKAIIVEGQIDALRLIQTGFDITVAGQGTAFGEGHVKELIALGINQVYLALDQDKAGQEAANKIGNFFQKEGVEVRVVQMPQGSDPDAFLKDKGPEEFKKLLEGSIDYLQFLVGHHSMTININSPAGKNELVQNLSAQIRSWSQPLMIHESLRRLAHLTSVPEDVVGVGQMHVPNIHIRKSASIAFQAINPDRILESDFLRWLLLAGSNQAKFLALAQVNLNPEQLRDSPSKQIYQSILTGSKEGKPCDLLSLAIQMNDAEAQQMLSDLVQKKINKDRAEEHFIDTVQKILDRNWMQKSEEIKMKIQSGQHSDDEVLELAKQFDEIKRNTPKVKQE